MAHATARGAYQQLIDRLNRFPQGAPPSELLYRILGLLFSEREAGLVAQLPIRPFDAKKAAALWKVPEAEARVMEKSPPGPTHVGILHQRESLAPRGPLRWLDGPIARILRPNLVARLESIRELLEGGAVVT